MSGYDYGNARLRAMRSRLLTNQDLRKLASASNQMEMVAFLSQSSYQRSLETALIQTSLLESIYQALRSDFIEIADRLSRFYQDKTRESVDILLRGYEIHNIKTVLRGISRHISRGEIQDSLLPLGHKSDTVHNEVLRAGTLREAIDILATLGSAYAQPLLILRAEIPGADMFDIEVALDRWHKKNAVASLKHEEDDTRLISSLRLDADLHNLMLVLRFVHQPAEKQYLNARLGKRTLDQVMMPEGRLPADLLDQVYQARGLRAAVELLSGTPYMPALLDGLRVYEQSGLLSEIERSLKRSQLRWLVSQIAADPLGIGVVLGYLALKTNEIANLRRIARGIQLKLSPEAILAGLELTG